MGINFKENSGSNIDREKYEKNHKRIFGNIEKVDCTECDLSSRQKKGEVFICPHCKERNK